MRMYVTTEDVLWLAGAIVAISAAIKVVFENSRIGAKSGE